ncbi:MAG: inositol monophosphatase [Deltaproteobacteria bacterium]|nr:inositol monophosphatase [Deltaproteobacteria bacterium]
MPLGPEELREILDRAHPIAREAASLVLEGWRRAPSIRSKAKSDLVTEFDTASERLLRDRLAQAFPSHGVVGEEAEGPQQRDRELVWYLDPIDGTTNFAHGHPFFCIAMGLVAREGDREEPVAGIVIAPALGTVWSAARGLGAHRKSALGDERIHVSSNARLEDALLSTGFPANRRANADNNYARFLELDSQTHGVRRCAAAAMEICLVADGAYDAFWDLGLKAWDCAAGAILVREAGGRVTNMDGTALDLHGGRLLASNGAIHSAMLETLSSAPSLPPGVA